MAELIKYEDSLRQGTDKLNESIEASNRAEQKSDEAVNNSVIAKETAESVQEQFNQVVIEGDSSVEAAQARVNSSNLKTYETLQKRLDTEYTEIKSDINSKADKEGLEHNLDLKRDKSTPITLNDVSEDVLDAIAGGEGSSFDLLTIPRDRSVTPIKTTFIEQVPSGHTEENINHLFVDTGAVNYLTGEINPNATSSLVSDLIDLSDVSFIFRYINDGQANERNTAHAICFYSETMNVVGGHGNINDAENTYFGGKYGYVYEIPANARYARMNVTKIVMDGSTSVNYNIEVVRQNYRNKLANDINDVELSEIKQEINNIKGLDKNIVMFGDSIIEFNTIPEQIARILGASVFDCSVGGTRMAKHNTNSQGILYNEMCMYRLSNYVNQGDFSDLLQAVEDLANLTGDDNSENMLTLTGLDWSTIDIAIIEHSTNDYAGNVPIGDNDDLLSDGTTFKGAINYTIQQLQTAYPNIQIIFTTPIYRTRFLQAGDGLNSDIHPNDLGFYLRDYADAIIEIAALNHIPVIDLYRECGINQYTSEIYHRPEDGVHPSQTGYNLIAQKIASGLKRHF